MKDLNGMTDEELAILYIEGNNAAFDLLLNRNQRKVFTYIMFVVRDRDVANDVFQDTFVKVITRLQQRRYVPNGKFCAWIMRIAHNEIMDWYRDQRNAKIVEAPKDNDLSNVGGDDVTLRSIESHYVYSQVMTDVRHMMDLLPAPQREVVFMRYYQDMSFKEIAETTGVSINTSLGRMRYAILNLRRMAKEHGVQLQLA